MSAAFFQGYLMGYLFFANIALGCLALLMMGHLTGGAWSLVPRRIFEAGAMTLPLLLVLFVPIAVGVRHTYPWAQPGAMDHSELLRHKHLYLNLPFFLVRAALYFTAWIVMAALLRAWSRRQEDPAADPVRLADRMRALSGPGLVIYGVTVTFAYIDWVMTLKPEWYSTIFGMVIVSGQGLSAYAFVSLVLAVLSRRPPLAAASSRKVFHDLGKMMLAFVMLWAYTAFCQFLITWAGNLPREISWYLQRLRGGWEWIGLVLIVGHFALPFLLLLSRDLKRHAGPLAAVAAFVLVMRMFDEYWLTMPSFSPGRITLHWMDVVAPIGLGGVWVGCFTWLLGRGPLLPLGAPYLDVAIQETKEPL